MEFLFPILVLLIGYSLWEFRHELRRLADSYAAPQAMPPNNPDKNGMTSEWKEWNDRKQQFRQQLDARIGARTPSDALNYEILKAQKLSPKIRRLVQEELPTSIRRCMGAHLVYAKASGVMFIYQIADLPEVFVYRERVIDVGQAAVEMIHEHPLLPDEPDLFGNLVTIRKGFCQRVAIVRFSDTEPTKRHDYALRPG